MNSIIEEPIEFSGVCDEPEGAIERHVRLMRLTEYNLRRFWSEARKFRTLFDAEINEDFSKFLSLIVRQVGDAIEPNGLYWVIDDFVGVYYLTDIRVKHSAQVHYSFFDRRHTGRLGLTRKMISHVFEKYDLRRMNAEFPTFVSEPVVNFIESIGFKREGLRKYAVQYKDAWYHQRLYGLLREETESWA